MIFDHAANKSTRKPLWMSRPFRRLLYIAGSLAALSAAALVAANTAWFRRALERGLISALESATGARVELGKLHINPLILQITFQDFTLHGTESRLEAPLLTAQTVVARVSPLALFRRHLVLRHLDLHYAAIHLLSKPDGTINIPGPRAPSEADQAVNDLIDLSIGRLALEHTQIIWNYQRVPIEVDASDVAITLRFTRPAYYKGSFTSSKTRIRGPGWSPPPFTISSRFELSRGGLNVDSLEWRSDGSSGHASLSLSNLAPPEGFISFQLRGAINDFAWLLRLPELRRGTIDLAGHATLRQGEARAQGRLQAREIVFQFTGFNPGRINISGDYSADLRHIDVSNLVVAGFGGTFQGRADISLQNPSPEFSVRTQLRGVDGAAVLHAFPRAHPALSRLRVASTIDGVAVASWSGLLRNFNSQFQLQSHPPGQRFPGALPLSGSARGQLAVAPIFLLSLEEAHLETPHSRLSARGKLSARQSSLALDLEASDFEEWRPLVEFLSGAPEPTPLSLESAVVFSGSATGPLSDLKTRGHVETKAFTYRGQSWDSLTASFVLAPDVFQISSGRLRRGNSTLTVNASANLHDWMMLPNSEASFSAQAQRTPLEGVEAALGFRYSLSGLATGRLDFKGRINNFSGAGVLRIEQGAFAQEPFDLLSTRIRIASSVWNLEEFQLTKGHGQLAGHLSFDPSRNFFSAEFHGAGFPLAQFSRLPPMDAETPRSRLDGQAEFGLQGSGTPNDVQLHSNWKIHDVRLDKNAIGDLQGQLEWKGREIRIEGQSVGQGGEIHFAAVASAEAGWPLELTGQFEKLRTDPWIRVLVKSKSEALVTSSGTFRVTGPIKEPGRLLARVHAQSLEIKFPSLTWKNENPVEMRYASGVLTADRFRVRGPSTNLEVEGSIHFGQITSLSINAEGQADATLLSLLDPGMQATGRSELKLRLGGTPAEPLLNGKLNVQNVSLSYAGLPFRVSGLNGEVRLEGQRAIAQSLRGRSSGGTVTLAGSVALGEPLQFEIRADVDQVRVPYPTDFTSVVSGNLRLAGTPESGQLGGELTVRQLFVSENLNLLTRVIEGASPIREQLPGISSPLASKIRLNVQVNSAPPARIETRDMRMLADLDLRLQGTLASPVALGIIHFRNGEAVFRGTRYKITRGEITLSNPLRTQPVIDIEASTRLQRYDLTVDISGPFDRLRLAYRSDPPLPEAEILSLLALGFSRQQEEMSASGSRPLSNVGASALLSEVLSSEVSGRVERLFGVSHIKIDPNVGAPGNSGGARVTVEQQVTRDFTLTYVTNTASSQYRIIQFEWAVSENTSLIGVRDQNGIFGVEVRFRHRFK